MEEYLKNLGSNLDSDDDFDTQVWPKVKSDLQDFNNDAKGAKI